jgi:hypothetical protein
MALLEDQAGISYEDVELDNLAEVTARVFASLRRFAIKDTIGLLDVLWSPPTYERLIGAWNLDNAEAVSAVQWLIAKVIAAVDNNEPPTVSA